MSHLKTAAISNALALCVVFSNASLGQTKNGDLPADGHPTDASNPTNAGSHVFAVGSQPLLLYDQDGATVAVREVRDWLEFDIKEPDPIFVSLEVDRDQNGKIDPFVDVAYRLPLGFKVCSEYLISETKNTACDKFSSDARMTQVKEEEGRKQFTLSVPKKELSFRQGSARVVVVAWNEAIRKTTIFPASRFADPIVIRYFPASLPSLSQEIDLSSVAGAGAVNCGAVRLDRWERPAVEARTASECAKYQFEHKKPFYVRFKHPGIDTLISEGMVMGPDGTVYQILDDIGIFGGHWVEPCSVPIEWKQPESGILNCVTEKDKREKAPGNSPAGR